MRKQELTPQESLPLPSCCTFLRSKPCWAQQRDPRRKAPLPRAPAWQPRAPATLGLSVHVAHRWWPGIMTQRSLPIESCPMILSACLWKPSMNSQRSNRHLWERKKPTLPSTPPLGRGVTSTPGKWFCQGIWGSKDKAREGHSAEAKGQLCAVPPTPSTLLPPLLSWLTGQRLTFP